jgi:thiol-disulfide isomerase/thioredoxin
MRRSTLFAVAGALALLTVAIGATRWVTGSFLPPGATQSGPPPAITSGRDVTLVFTDRPQPSPVIALTDLEGKPVDIAAWRGKVVLVNFWATWCGPCREEIPALLAIQEHYRDQVAILGLSIDTKPAAEVRQFAAEFKLNYPVAMSNEEIEKGFGGVSAVPVTFVIDPEGRVVQHHEPGHSGTDPRPDGQTDVLQLNLAIERVFDDRLVLVLILVEINQEGKRQDYSGH